jgi:hypothetical protein
MEIALGLLAFQGIIGAFDTLYYHEWRARLPARGRLAAPELRLHAARDFLYGFLFAALSSASWRGLWVIVLVGVLAAEIVLTLTDFVVEVRVRRPIGDVYAGERVTHAVMGIIYGAMIACLVPTLVQGWREPTGVGALQPPISEVLRWSLLAMAAGVVVSGVRDLYACSGYGHASWPWPREEAPVSG